MIVLKVVWFFIDLVREPPSLGIKVVALALWLREPSWSGFLLLVIVTLSTSIFLVTSAIRSSENAVRSLWQYISERKEKRWTRTTPFSGEDLRLIHGLQHLDMNLRCGFGERQLHFLTYEGNRSLDCRCYFNLGGSSFVLTSNANADFNKLPDLQKFVIYHEIGHASLAGGELWVGGAIETVATYFAAALAAFTITTNRSWGTYILGILAVFGAAVHNSQISRYRDECAEAFANRYGLRVLEKLGPKRALSVSDHLGLIWMKALVNPSVPEDRAVKLLPQLRYLALEQRRLQRIIDGKFAYNVDPRSSINWTLYVWATVLFFWVFLYGDISSESCLPFAVFGLVILFAICLILKIRSCQRIKEYEIKIFGICHEVQREFRMSNDNSVAEQLIRTIDPT